MAWLGFLFRHFEISNQVNFLTVAGLVTALLWLGIEPSTSISRVECSIRWTTESCPKLIRHMVNAVFLQYCSHQYWMGSINLLSFIALSLLSINSAASRREKSLWENLRNAENRTWDRRARSKYAIHCAMRPPITFHRQSFESDLRHLIIQLRGSLGSF